MQHKPVVMAGDVLGAAFHLSSEVGYEGMMKGFCLVGPYLHWHLEFDEKALGGTTRYHQVHRSDTILFTTPVTILFLGHLMACTGITVSNPKLINQPSTQEQ